MRQAAAFLGVFCLSVAPAAAQAQYPFQDPNLPIEERVTNIISLLTPEEKIEVLGANYYLGKSPSLARL